MVPIISAGRASRGRTPKIHTRSRSAQTAQEEKFSWPFGNQPEAQRQPSCKSRLALQVGLSSAMLNLGLVR